MVLFMNVIYQVLYVNWLKVNIDSTIRGYLDFATCFSIFRGSWVNISIIFLGVFVYHAETSCSSLES